MFWAFVSSFVGTVLLCIACASVSYNPGVVKNTPWALLTVDVDGADADLTTYMGLRKYVTVCDGNDCAETQVSERWSTSDCDRADDDGFSDFCNDCKDASAGTVSTAIMSLITNIPQMTTDLQRSIVGGDVNCQKFMGMATGILGTITTLSAISEWKAGCYDSIPDHLDGSDVDISFGAAFYCIVFATILKVFDTICHFLIPMPKEGYWEPPEWSGGKKRDNIDKKLVTDTQPTQDGADNQAL